MRTALIALALGILVCFCSCQTRNRKGSFSKAPGVKITQAGNEVHVSINGQPFTDYIYEGVSRPILYPLLGPGQAPMTRAWPVEQSVEGEEHDHVHHKSVWYEHGKLNGIDFWSEEPGAGKTVHVKFLQIKSGSKEGIIQSTNILVSSSNTIVATDQRTLRFYATSAGKMFDYEITTYASHGPITFGDTKEGTMAIRIAETMRIARQKKRADGHIVLSTGIRDNDTWGKRADWCDYYGPVDSRILGIAIFDHPGNPRHPTWWHVRDYGLLAANPFGLHDFEKKPADAGNLTIPAGQSITFKYRIYLHEGDEKQGRVAEHYADYARQP